jgi:hypothetical protein
VPTRSPRVAPRARRPPPTASDVTGGLPPAAPSPTTHHVRTPGVVCRVVRAVRGRILSADSDRKRIATWPSTTRSARPPAVRSPT